MKATSKYFLTKFGPNWKKGRDILNHNGPAELSLPGDDAFAMRVIFAVIHHQPDKIPQAQMLVSWRVLSVATAANKYDLINAMKLASGNWLRTEEKHVRDLMYLTVAAQLFQNGIAFKEITQALVLKHIGSFAGISDEELQPLMLLCK